MTITAGDIEVGEMFEFGSYTCIRVNGYDFDLEEILSTPDVGSPVYVVVLNGDKSGEIFYIAADDAVERIELEKLSRSLYLKTHEAQWTNG